MKDACSKQCYHPSHPVWLRVLAISAEDLSQLEVVHKQWLRCIPGITIRDHKRNIDIREQCCHQPPVKIMVTKKRFRWFGHACFMENRRTPKQIFRSDRSTV